MTVNSYLVRRAGEALLRTDEKAAIDTSIATVASRLRSYFPNELAEQFRFGSSTRDTILPRQMDEASDIDYMVVFKDTDVTPQAHLDRLRRFADTYYATSTIKQSNPSLVLELNHIKFDLVPARKNFWTSGYEIPKRGGGWQSTDPNDFNKSLEQANKNHRYLLKPTIRLAKFWNAQAGGVFDSFLFEREIAGFGYWFDTTQRDYLFNVFGNLSANTSEQWRNERIRRAKDIVAEVKDLEGSGWLERAETAVKKLIPEF